MMRMNRSADSTACRACSRGLPPREACSTSRRKHCRRAAGLLAQPLPVARQQGHLARHHAQFRAARPASGAPEASRVPVRQAGQHLIDRAAEVDFDRPAADVVEDQQRFAGAFLDRLFRCADHLVQGAAGDQAMVIESAAGGVCRSGHGRVHAGEWRRILPGSNGLSILPGQKNGQGGRIWARSHGPRPRPALLWLALSTRRNQQG